MIVRKNHQNRRCLKYDHLVKFLITYKIKQPDDRAYTIVNNHVKIVISLDGCVCPCSLTF